MDELVVLELRRPGLGVDDQDVLHVHAGLGLVLLTQVEHPVHAVGDDRQSQSNLERNQPESGLVVQQRSDDGS